MLPKQSYPHTRANAISGIDKATRLLVGVFLLLPILALAEAQMHTPGAFGVSEFGGANYSISLSVPPGTTGMAPSLSLNYSSQSSNGPIGMGWFLGGLSVVHRCPATLAQDGFKGSVSYDANDRFCLDGQRLVMITPGGTYGGNGVEYRTARDSFTRIISFGNAGGGPAYFQAWSKSGQILEFGATTNSAIPAVGKTSFRLWALNKVSDRLGNYLTVTYDNDTANGHYYPLRIDYTGNTTSAVAPYNAVKFIYETRFDAALAYLGGSSTREAKRLINIQTFVSGTTLVKDYRLAYSTGAATSRSRLISLTECGDFSTGCLNPTTFAWQDYNASSTTFTSAGSTATGYSDSGGANSGLRFFPVDVNADGKTDLLVRDALGNLQALRSNGATFTSAGTTPTSFTDAAGWNSGLRFFPIDMNGDGKTDFVARDAAGNLLTYLSNGATYTLAGTTPTSFTDAAGWNSGLRFFPMDVNGDGRADLVARDSAGGFATWLSNGATFVFNGSIATGYSDANGWNTGVRFFPMDVNGDAKTDLVARDTAGNLQVLLSNGTTFALAATTATGFTDTASRTFLPADVNGDGKGDLLFLDLAVGRLTTYLSDGANFVNSATTFITGSDCFPLDVNGDGKTDVVTRDSNGTLKIWLSNGSAFTAAGSMASSFSDSAGWNSGVRFFRTDVNGDGKMDLLARDATGNVQTLLSAGVFPDLLSSITNGLGAVTTITYKPLTDASVYTKSTDAIYPYQDLQLPLYVVSISSATNGIGGTYSTRYTYAGAKAHLTGGGILGFSQVTVWDDQTSIRTVTNYRQDYPYQGLVTLVDKRTFSGTLLYQLDNIIWQDNGAFPGVRSPFMAQKTESSFELNNPGAAAFLSVTSASQFDAFGNLTQITASTNDNFAKTITSTFSNDATSWIIGRKTQEQVNSTIPGGVSQLRTTAFTY